jgi:dienelactone hydrolase
MQEMEIASTDMKFTCPDATEMIAYLSRPKDSARHPGIIVIHEAWGLNDQIKGVVRRYAENGFVAVAPTDLLCKVDKSKLVGSK